ncbi:MAG TPA: helicase-exonuclease AddAB subunit AddA [Clostridiaceae bacterium]|nr:helicase-exonuclease AddAB subunit AddA [Clostridiaceae bacterium]
MAENKWTGEQWEAITGKDCNLLVAAAAGAGKTAVLVERIIRKITDEENPVDIDRLLVVTFTNAAATEMRERIAEAISERLEKNPGSVNIQRQLTLLGKASITTIHSFCLEVIRSNFQHINIDPGFRIADETESQLLKLEALSEVFEEQYENENADFFELLECYGGNRDDQALQDMVLNLYGFIQSSPWPEEWLEKMTESMNVPDGTDFGETPWGRVLLDSVKLELEGLREMMTRALHLIGDSPQASKKGQDSGGLSPSASGLEKYQAVYMEDLANVDAMLKLLNEGNEMQWDSIFHALQSIEFATLPRCGKEVDREKQEIVKKIRDDVKARIKKLREKMVTAGSTEIIYDLKALYPKMKCLAGLVNLLAEKYAEKKSRKSVVDFNDLEHFCLEILSVKGEDGNLKPSGTALGYRERFAEILVDEYQDSNLVQEIIISMISRADTDKPNVFMVGDVKQSIYRFRQARPELFLDKYNTYSPDKGNPFRKILLFKNFRSRREVVDAVNFLFKQIMSVNVGELDYTNTEALNSGAVFAEIGREDMMAGGETELHLIQTGGGDDISAVENEGEEGQEDADEGQEDEEMLDNVQCEARLVGSRILELMKPDEKGRHFCVFDRAKKEYRKVEFRDIVILLRTTKNWSEVFVDELSMMGIPAFADTGTGFFKTVEVQVMLSLLQIIDNPLQDIPLLSVLRSPIAAFTTDELAELRLADRKASLFDALKKLAESGQGETAQKAAAFLESLQKWREMSLYMSTDQLLWQLYNDTGYYGMVGAMPAGEQRQANLRMLFERARQFEETSFKGLFNFINFIDKLKSSKGDMGSAKILGENDNVVRIMSIHKSKGLEFPVVILAGCGKKFNLQDMNKSILLHQDLGFGPDVVDHRLRLSWPSAAKQAIREKIKAETLSEEMRILYVALTRAREKLIITGAVNDAAKAVGKWSASAAGQESRLPGYEMLKGGNYLDWIGPALLRHKSCSGLRDSGATGSEFHGLLIDDPSVWSIKIWNKSDVLSSRISEEPEESEFIRWLDSLETAEELSEFSEEITRRLSWDYAYVKASRVPAKVSVTELKRRFNAELSEEVGAFPEYLPVLVKKPMFLEEKKGLTHAEKGTVLHFVMQHLDYNREDIEAQIEGMVARDLLTEQQAQSVDVGKIHRFLESPLGKRMLASGSINREVPFNIEIPCHELYKDMEDEACHGETLLLQGVIDCYFEEPDGIVLVDYKTDYVPAGKVEMIRERYRLQILYYARALEMLTGNWVKEKYIYLFWNGEVLEF